MREGRWEGFDVLGQLPALRRYARSLAGDEADAEDLVHDALVRAYERRRTFRPGGNLRTWLLSVLHNTFVSGWRSRRAELARIAGATELADPRIGPGQDGAVRLAELMQAFRALPEEQRATLHLVAVEGLSYQEAALALGIPIGTLMSRLGRARTALRAAERTEHLALSRPSDGRRGCLRVVEGEGRDDQADRTDL
jgi:RNA polymerase sigma-70 factor (ECF subfamily)